MGVPGLTFFIFQRFSRAVFAKFKKQTRVYFDGNDVIHGACAASEGNDPVRVAREVVFFMKDIMSRVERTTEIQSISFVIDGVCCVGKIQQQRARRLVASNEKRSYDTLQVTSGTEFMSSLADELRVLFAKEFSVPATVSYDLDAGEGEHVIFDQIADDSLREEIPTSKLVVGRDGDISNIAMMRCAKHVVIRTVKMDQRSGDQEKFIDVDSYVKLLEEMDIDPQMWVVAMFLAGNDFLPHLFGIHNGFGVIGDILLRSVKGKKFVMPCSANDVFSLISLVLRDAVALRQRCVHFAFEDQRFDDVFVAVHQNDRKFIRTTESSRKRRQALTGDPLFTREQLRRAKIDCAANYADVFLWNTAYYLGLKEARSCEVYYKYSIPPCSSVLNSAVFDLITRKCSLRCFKLKGNHRMSKEDQHAVVMPRENPPDSHVMIEVFVDDKGDHRNTKVFLPIPLEPFASLRYC